MEKLRKIDNLFNVFIQKGGSNKFLEYLIKYLLVCGGVLHLMGAFTYFV